CTPCNTCCNVTNNATPANGRRSMIHDGNVNLGLGRELMAIARAIPLLVRMLQRELSSNLTQPLCVILDDEPAHVRDVSGGLRVHLHGVDQTGQDHQSLRHTPAQHLQAVLNALADADYQGVLTLEVFGQEDFFSSLHTLQHMLQRYE
ncbi:MAG: hypothetical protein M1546_24485, partial [Chloroflexi bacterium]|nr:hypothetical protein [Chloroflexota bacterium]